MEIAVAVPACPLPSSNKILLLQILFRILFLGWITLRKHRWVTFAERRRSCPSAKLIELISETCLHFPGLNGLKAVPIFVFPKIVLCTDCGLMQANLSATDLELIRHAYAKVEGASSGSGSRPQVPVNREK
jgi:hypothetical protein